MSSKYIQPLVRIFLFSLCLFQGWKWTFVGTFYSGGSPPAWHDWTHQWFKLCLTTLFPTSDPLIPTHRHKRVSNHEMASPTKAVRGQLDVERLLVGWLTHVYDTKYKSLPECLKTAFLDVFWSQRSIYNIIFMPSNCYISTCSSCKQRTTFIFNCNTPRQPPPRPPFFLSGKDPFKSVMVQDILQRSCNFMITTESYQDCVLKNNSYWLSGIQNLQGQ